MDHHDLKFAESENAQENLAEKEGSLAQAPNITEPVKHRIDLSVDHGEAKVELESD